jgi:hypothetical protein
MAGVARRRGPSTDLEDLDLFRCPDQLVVFHKRKPLAAQRRMAQYHRLLRIHCFS